MPSSLPTSARRGATSPMHRMRRPRRIGRSRRQGRQRGMVLLSVLLVIMLGTTIATVTMHDTTRALRNTRALRVDVQGRYAAEGTLMATLTYLDFAGEKGLLRSHVLAQAKSDNPFAAPPNAMPMLPMFAAEPNIPLWPLAPGLGQADRHDPFRITGNLLERAQNPALEIPPTTAPGYTNGTLTDLHGNFGPQTAYSPKEDFVTDFYDCVTSSPEAGENSGSGNDDSAAVRRRCTVTVRQRSVVLALEATPTSYTWPLPGGNTYLYNDFQSIHEATATILTPPAPK